MLPAILLAAAFAQDITIEDYTFVWSVAKNGEQALEVVKDPEKTVVRLRSEFNVIDMTAADAVALGKVLAETGKHADALKGKDATASAKTKNHTVQFVNSPTAGFLVVLTENRQFAFGSVGLDRKGSLAFAKELQRADKLVELVDRKIRP